MVRVCRPGGLIVMTAWVNDVNAKTTLEKRIREVRSG
jgi:hypothetical protein